jgi:cytochrome oxidase Cu insertion factor (SCO1/SenC/PrrC family)
MKSFSAILVCAMVAGACLCLDLMTLTAMEPLEVGTTAPDFALPDLDGKQVSRSDFEGQIVLLNFWTPT